MANKKNNNSKASVNTGKVVSTPVKYNLNWAAQDGRITNNEILKIANNKGVEAGKVATTAQKRFGDSMLGSKVPGLYGLSSRTANNGSGSQNNGNNQNNTVDFTDTLRQVYQDLYSGMDQWQQNMQTDMESRFNTPMESSGLAPSGSGVSSMATSWRARKGRRAAAGRDAQGVNSMTIRPTSNSIGVGLNT